MGKIELIVVLVSTTIAFVAYRLREAEDSISKVRKDNKNLYEEIREAKDSIAKFQKDNTDLKEEVKLLLSDSRTVGFHVSLSKELNLGSSQTVVFDKIISNIGNSYNSHSGSFTVPFNGLYFLTSSFLSQSGKTDLHLRMMKNEQEITRGYSSAPGTQSGSMSAVVSLKRGDVVKVQHLPGVHSQTIHGDYSFFTGYLIKITE